MSIDQTQLLLLLNWMSPGFPVGGFAYSHGLEQAIADGTIKTTEDLQNWIGDLVTRGSGWTDAVLFACCWSDDAAEINALALALAGSKERHEETVQLGRNFRIAAQVWMDGEAAHGDVAYPVAAATACARLGIARDMALTAFIQGFCAAQVSVAVRLVPLGQTSGLRVLKALAPVIAATALRASHATRDDLGSATVLAEIAAMRHETLETRIFRT